MHHILAVSLFQTCWDLSLDDVVDTNLEQFDFMVSAYQLRLVLGNSNDEFGTVVTGSNAI